MHKHTPEFIEIMNRYKNYLKENKQIKLNINNIIDERNKQIFKNSQNEENEFGNDVHFQGVDNKAIQNRLKNDKLVKKKGNKMHLKNLLKILDEHKESEENLKTEETINTNEILIKDQIIKNNTNQSSYLTELNNMKLPIISSKLSINL